MPPVVTTAASQADPHSNAPNQSMPHGGSYGRALTLLATLFFMWGFITVINNTLLPHLRSVFELTYTQTTLIDRCGSSPISLPRSPRPS
jgi:FHS family L-fucose permease-like MFS transporter